MKKESQLLVVVLILATTVLAACGPFGGAPREKTVYVGPYQVDCVGVAPQKCLLVKEKPEEDWTLLYDQIEGFEYEAGFEYELRIAEEKVDNPPADASSIRWTLIKIVSQERTLEGTTWVLESYSNSEGQTVAVLPSSEVTAIFQDGQVGGNASCNSYFGTYETDGGKLTVSVGGSTMMFCAPEELMAQETDYLAALNTAAFHLVTEDQLRIADASGQTVLQYEVLKPSSLVGPTWQLGWYNNGTGGYSSVLLGTEITATFSEDGNLSGSAGCNNYMASYEVDGDRISIEPAASTRMMCAEPEGIMEQEAAYLAALESATTYEIRGDELEMRDGQGTRAVTLVVKAEAAGPDEETLKNMAYKSEWTKSGMAPLADGEYREQAAPGSATETVVRLTDYIAYGQLNGQDAAAVVLVTDPGGSGTFYDLAIVVEQDGQPVNVATTSLGDRAKINSLSIENNEIVVDMITHGPDDAMCCPTQQVVQTYALQGDQLVQTSSEVAGSAAGGGSDLVGETWNWIGFSDPVQGPKAIEDPDRYTVAFQADGAVHIQADCNRASGSFTAEGASISIELGPMTLAACGPDSLGDLFLQYLSEAALYRIEGGELFLDLPADSGTMRLGQSE